MIGFLKDIRSKTLIWLLTPRYKLQTQREYYRNKAISNAIFMAVITIGARLLGMSSGVMAAHGFFADVLFNVVVGTIVLHVIDRMRPVVYV